MKKIRDLIEKTNKNFKKEIFKNVLILILIFSFEVILTLYFKTYYVLIVLILVTVLAYPWFLNIHYQNIINKNNNKLVLDFIDTFSYFRIYISNNMNVYQAFNQIKNYASPYIKQLIEKLLNEIDEDSSLQPFINFSKNFNNEKVEEVMIAIYEMVNEGNNETYLNQFISIFTSFKNRIEEDQYTKRKSKFDTINQFSLLGSGTLMISIMFGIVSLLGVYIQ